MSTTRAFPHWWHRRLVPVLLLSWAAGCTEPNQPSPATPTALAPALAAGGTPLAPEDLGSLGGPSSQALGINDVGQVTGTSSVGPTGQTRPFLWDRGVMTDLGALVPDSRFGFAFAVNSRGQVVGSSGLASGQRHAFLWHAGIMTDLGTLGGASSQASDINDEGVIVGQANTAAGETHAFLWVDGTMTDLGTFGGTFNQAQSINNLGQVVGVSTLPDGQGRPFLWEEGIMTELPALGGSFSVAWSINDRGQIVGESRLPTGETHAVLWENGSVKDLGTLGGTYARAHSVNESGQVVGFSTLANGQWRAFLWESGTMTDLGTLGGTLSMARAIDNQGRVVGWSSLANGHIRATIWTRAAVGGGELRFVTQPGRALSGIPFATQPVVEVLDASGNRVEGRTVRVTLTLGTNPSMGHLAGTSSVTTSTGLAAFTDLSIDEAGAGYTLIASAPDADDATSEPFDVAVRFASVSVSSFMGCGLSAGGDGYCWGRNQTGGLGIGSAGANRARPALVTGGLTFRALDAGSGSGENGFWDGFGCGITTDGDTYCWGRNNFGQLGNGSSGTDSNVPVLVQGGLTFVTVSAGRDHTCALTAEGVAYCWGRNVTGGLGDGTTNNRDVPGPVAGGHFWSRIDVGGPDTCALDLEGDVYCWGSQPSSLPGPWVTVPTALASGVKFKSLSTGQFLHRCGVSTTDDGYCWGQNFYGELGNGSDTTDSEVPVLVSGGLKFKAVQAGQQFTCGLTLAGEAYCWGGDFGLGDGALGQGVFATSNTPLKVVGGLSFTSLSVGGRTSCAVVPSGAGYCWGNGYWGERADGTFTLPGFSPGAIKAP